MHNLNKMSDYKTIRVYGSTYHNLNEIKKQFGGSKCEILENSTKYFLATKINPNEEPKDMNTEFKKLKNSLISYIKTQDKNIEINTKKIDALISEFKKVLSENNQSNITQENMKLMLQSFGKILIEKIKR